MSPLRGEFNIFTAYSCLKQTADIIEWFSNVVIITLSLVNFICAPFDASFEIDTRFKHKLEVYRTSLKIIFYLCHMQVHLSGNNIPMVKPPPNYTSPPFLQHILGQCCNHLGILSSIEEILLSNLVFYDGVTPVSISTLKPLLRVIGVLLLKPQASPILSVCIKD